MIAKLKIIRIAYVTMVIGVLILSACGGRTKPAKFYTLQPVEQSSTGKSLPLYVTLAVGPVAIPAALDRAEIVTRDADNVLSFSDYNRWAGPLDTDIATVMAQNIATLLESDRITPFTLENLFFQPTHRVVIIINRYESQLAREFLIDATWSIKDLKSSKLLLIRNSTIRETLASADYEELVAAQSKALAALSKIIAEAVLESVLENK
jgi:uncharacterized lipoprotein YmbA